MNKISIRNPFPVLFALILTAILLILATPGWAQSTTKFNDGYLTIFKVTSSSALANTGTAIIMEEYAPSGSQSSPNFNVALPSNSSSVGVNDIVVSGTATSSGGISRSENGRYLLIPGYKALIGSANSTFNTNSVVRTVNGAGTMGSGISGANYSSGNNNLRGATSDDLTNYWMSGNGLGIRTTSNGTTLTTVSTTVTNNRDVFIFNGQLYLTTGSGTTAPYSVGTGKPISTGNTATALFTPLSGTTNDNNSPYSFAISPDGNTVYVTDDGSGSGGDPGIYRYVNNSGWSGVKIYTTSMSGLAVDWSGYSFNAASANGAKLYACNATTLVTANDNGTTTISATTLRTISGNNAFRQLSFSPIKQTVSLGANTPATSSITTGNTNVVLFQFKVTADEGNSTLKKVIINQSGTASIGSGNSISNFRLIDDANNDGVAQSGEISASLSTGTISGSDITFSSITLSSYINEGSNKNFLVIGDVSGSGTGTFIPSIVSNKTLNSVNYTTNITNAGGSWLNIGTTAPSGNTLTITGGTTTVNLGINTGTGTEAATTSIILTLSSGAAVSGTQTVDVALTGSGLTNADFTGATFPTQISITNGNTSGTLSFNINDDVISEGTETATFTISNPSAGITLGSTVSQNLAITDNDNPAISTTGSLVTFCTATGTASSDQTFTVSGDFLTGNLTVTPPAGFEVSTDGGSTYGTSQSVPVSGGNVTGEPFTVYARIASTASVGSPGGNISISGGGATTQNIAASGTVGEAVTLAAGDISIIGFNGTGTDRFAFVNWVSIADQAKITFTDNAWTTASGPLATNENTCVWQNNTGAAIPAGTVIVFVNGSGFDLGTLLSGTMSGISSGAENIFAYQGPVCNPTFIFGLISGTSTWVTSGTPSNSDSYLPSSLSTANITMGANGNGQYTASRSNQSTIAAYKSIVNNISNWTTSSSEVNPVSSTDFTIGSNPDVNLTVSSGATTETGAPTITVTLIASAAVSGDQTVTLAVTGTNITGTDYNLSSTTITILSGQTTGTVTFQILDDSNVEGSETATLTISSPSSGIIIGTTVAQNISITDNDGSTFYSQANGNANTGAIWDIVPSGTGQTITSLGGFSNVRNIVIQNGHTVTLGTSGTDVLDLTVNAGGILKAGSTSNAYFDVFGNITCNGTMGAGSANDGLSFNIESNSCVFNGNGTIDLARIRKDATAPATSSIIINADINLRFNGACFYNNANFTNFNITIGSGYTVNVMGDDGTNGEVSIDGTNGASGSERGGSITVNGSLIVSKKIYALSNNNATYPCTFIIGSSGVVRTYNIDLNINNPGFTAFTINNGGVITVTNNFAVQGGSLTTNNGVVIGSGGSLMHGSGTPSGGGLVSGNVTVKRQGTTNANSYNYWSTPVAGGTVPGSGAYEYIALNGTNAYTDDNNPSPDPGWSAFSGTMTTAKGYASKGAGLASFTGVPNNGNISIGVTTSAQPLSSTTAPSKFNLIGNPYPCALSANALISGNSGIIAGSIYLWDDDGSGGNGYASNDYGVWNGAGQVSASGHTPTNNIGSGQGFIVEAVATGNVSFTNAMRNNNNTQFFKTEEDTFMNRIWLSLNDNANTLYNEILIAFKSDATEERDLMYDAYKLHGSHEISLASIQGEDEFVIVAFPPVTDERIIPLSVFIETPGNYTLKNKYIEYMEGIPVYLEDRLLGTYTDISNNGAYSAFMSNDNSVDRFFLHFAALATSIPENQGALMRTYSNGNELITLLSNFSENTGTLRIIDMTGKEVYAQQNVNLKNNFISISTTGFPSGIYAINLVTPANSYTTKTFIK